MKSMMRNLKRKSNSWATSSERQISKRPKLIDKDVRFLTDFQEAPEEWSDHHDSAHIEDVSEDERMDVDSDTESISSVSTNATMDDIPGTGRTIDKYFYQPVGRAIERFAPKITMRFNFGHPSPAQILRVLQLSPDLVLWLSNAEKPSDLMDSISTDRPSAVPGILSLVHQSQ